MSVPNRGPELLGVNVAFIATAITAYLLRCFVRVKMVKAFGFDDWLMGLALVRTEYSTP
jgi:spore maturation protein SpmB